MTFTLFVDLLLIILLVGLGIYLFIIDRRVKKMLSALKAVYPALREFSETAEKTALTASSLMRNVKVGALVARAAERSTGLAADSGMVPPAAPELGLAPVAAAVPEPEARISGVFRLPDRKGMLATLKKTLEERSL